MKIECEEEIQKLKPEAKARRYSIGRGLYLEVSPCGGKYFRFKYRFQGRAKMLSMGVFPDVSLQEAKKRRDDARRLVANNIDPSEKRKAEKGKINGLSFKLQLPPYLPFKRVPEAPGVYFLFNKKRSPELIYIGQTKNTAVRIKELRLRFDFDYAYYIEIEDEKTRRMVEKTYIKYFIPIFNITFGVGRRKPYPQKKVSKWGKNHETS